MVTSHFAATPQSDVARICAHDFRRHGDTFGTTENARFHKITISPTSLFSANFNGNRVKNHPKPYLDLSFKVTASSQQALCQVYKQEGHVKDIDLQKVIIHRVSDLSTHSQLSEIAV